MLIVKAYNFTTITSVMLLMDFTIPSAFLMSISFLKVKYCFFHYVALLFCLSGLACNLYNDMTKENGPSDGNGEEHSKSDIIIGDIMALAGAFLYALSNILQEFLLKTHQDVIDYLGFLGFFGVIITLIEAASFGEFTHIANCEALQIEGNGGFLTWNLVSFSCFNFVCYSTIPYFVKRSGATLLNISNVTTVIYSMLADILVFKKRFYYLNVIAFVLEFIGIVVFSLRKPTRIKAQNRGSGETTSTKHLTLLESKWSGDSESR